jgi:hypothetical protein
MTIAERDILLIQLRPQLNVEIDGSSEMELFQTKTLRPICKFQNDTVLFIMNDYLKLHKIQLNQLTFTAQKERIRSILKADNHLKTKLVMLVIGLFTVNELSFYHQYRSEVNKRIFDLILKRIQDQIELLN